METYHKIDTLFTFNTETKRYDPVYFNKIAAYLQRADWLCTEKVDGTNMRVEWDGHRVSWNGATDKSELTPEMQELMQSTFGESEIIFEQTFGGKPVMLFMECYGGKIQGGAYGGKERLIGFDVKVNGIYLDRTIIKDIFAKFGVPVVNTFVAKLNELIASMAHQIMANKVPTSPLCEKGKTPIEGYVCTPIVRLYDHQGNRVIVKVKYRDLRKTPSVLDENK